MRVGDSKSSDVNSSTLYFDISDDQWPIVYRSEYDVRFWGLELLHPFDAHKWGRVANVGILPASDLTFLNVIKIVVPD